MDTRITQFLGHVDIFTRRISGLETDRREGPSPCEGWTARDVLDHVIDTQRDVFSRCGLDLGPSPAGGPTETWSAHADALRSAVRDENALLGRYDGMFGPTTLADVLLSFHAFDLIIHAWGIHRAGGSDLNLTEAELAILVPASHQPDSGPARRSDNRFTRKPTHVTGNLEDGRSEDRVHG